MGKFGKNMGPMSSQAPLAQRAYLYHRARSSGLTKAEALRVIFNFWLHLGAPALTDYELEKEALPEIPEDAKAKLFDTTRATFERIPAHWDSLFPLPSGEGDPVGPQARASMLRRAQQGESLDVRSNGA